MPGSLGPNPFPAIQSGGGGCLPTPIIPTVDENIPSKLLQREDPLDFPPYLRDMEERTWNRNRTQETKDAVFCSTGGRKGCCSQSLQEGAQVLG